jgi:nitroreductase
METVVKKKSSEFHSPVLEVIQHRRSRRAYDSKPVPQEAINSLFEAARWAPSSVNEQPWLYLYATNDQSELWARIFDSLNPSNQVWVKDAPLLIVSFARTHFTRNDKPNGSARYDLGGANAFLSLQATHLGLNVHQMGGFNAEKLRADLNTPAHYEPVTVLAIGYPGEAEKLPENLKLREIAPRERYIRDEFVLNKLF